MLISADAHCELMPWCPRQHEAELVAALFRQSRLVVLLGPPGAGKSRFLDREVLTLLRQGNDLSLLISDWKEAPLMILAAALRKKMQTAPPVVHGGVQRVDFGLVDELAELGRERHINCLLIFDQFERFLESPVDSESRNFADVFVDLVTRPDLRVNVLVSLRDDAERRMNARFGDRVTGLGGATLRLLHWRRAAVAKPILRDDIEQPLVPALTADAPVSDAHSFDEIAPLVRAAPAMEPAPVVTATAASEPALPERGVDPLTWLGPELQPAATPALATAAEEPPLGQSLRLPPRVENLNPRRGFRDRPLKWLSVPVVAALLVALIWIQWRSGGSPVPGVATELTQETAAAPSSAVALPQLSLIADSAGGSGPLVAADLARWVAPVAGIHLRVVASSDAIDTLYRLGDGTAAGVAIVQYDLLQLLRRQGAQGEPRARLALERLRTLAPMQRDEILFIARADSPLRYVHELKGRTINVGPVGSSGSITSTEIYRTMFGEAPQRAASFDYADAMRKLLNDRSIDAVAVIGTPAQQPAGAIKLLEVDRDHPTSKRAARTYLPMTIRAQDHAGWLKKDIAGLSVMSFLITGDANAAHAGALVKAMCDKQATLRGSGHRKWRDVPIGLDLTAHWNVLPAAEFATACNAS